MIQITPSIWGPHGWKFMHFIAMAYPLEPTDIEKENYKNFFTSLGDVLPCKMCSEHYKKNLLKYPLTDKVLENKVNLTFWTIDIHNEVNAINNKKIYSYDDAIDLIKNNFNDTPINITNDGILYGNYPENKEHFENYESIETDYYKYFLLFLILIIAIFGLYFTIKNKRKF